MKKNQKVSDHFWHRKLTLKVKFWHFLTAGPYSNSPNLVISLDYSWFLAKNLSNFVSLPWELYNQYCHSGKISDFGTTTLVCNIYRISYWWNDTTMCNNLFINLVCRNIKKNIGKQKVRKTNKKCQNYWGEWGSSYFTTKF